MLALDLRGFGSGAGELRWKQNGLAELLAASIVPSCVELFSYLPLEFGVDCPASTIYLNEQLH
jgi:hypothetical protein